MESLIEKEVRSKNSEVRSQKRENTEGRYF